MENRVSRYIYKVTLFSPIISLANWMTLTFYSILLQDNKIFINYMMFYMSALLVMLCVPMAFYGYFKRKVYAEKVRFISVISLVMTLALTLFYAVILFYNATNRFNV